MMNSCSQAHRIIRTIGTFVFLLFSLSRLNSGVITQKQDVAITPIAFTSKIEIDWGEGKGIIDLSDFGGRNMMKELGLTVLPKYFGRAYYHFEGEVRAVFAIPGAKCMFTISFTFKTKNVLVSLPSSLQKYHGHINSCGALALTAMPKSVKLGYAVTYTREGFIYILGPDGSTVIDTTCIYSMQNQSCLHFWMRNELIDSTGVVDQVGHGYFTPAATWGGKILKLTAYFALQKDFLKYEHFFFRDGKHGRLEAALIDSLQVPVESMNASGVDSTKNFMIPSKQKE